MTTSEAPPQEREATYLEARDVAWSTYHAVTGDASLAYWRGAITASEFMLVRESARATLDDELTVARRAAGYQR